MATHRTLDRGLKALFLISQSDDGISVSELASELSIDRAIAYRIVSTLEDNGLASRRDGGRVFLGAGVVQFEARYLSQFRRMIKPILQMLATTADATAFLSLAEGDDCVAVVVAEPDTSFLRVGYRVGSKHPLNLSAAGIAILSGRKPTQDESDEVRQARQDGYSLTRGALQKGAVGIACSVKSPHLSSQLLEGSVGVVAMEGLDVDHAKALVVRCADEINHRLVDGK